MGTAWIALERFINLVLKSLILFICYCTYFKNPELLRNLGIQSPRDSCKPFGLARTQAFISTQGSFWLHRASSLVKF